MGPHFDRTLLWGALDILFPQCAHTRTPLVEENRGDWWYVGRQPQASLPPHPSPSLEAAPVLREAGGSPYATEGSSPVLMLLSSRLRLGGMVRVSQGSGKVDLKAVQLPVGMARRADGWPKLRPTEAETPWLQPGSLRFNKPSRQL